MSCWVLGALARRELFSPVQRCWGMNIFRLLSLLQVPVAPLMPWLGEGQPPLSVLQAEHGPLPGSRSRAGLLPSPLGTAGPGRAAWPVPISSSLGGSPVGSALSAQQLEALAMSPPGRQESALRVFPGLSCCCCVCLWREGRGLGLNGTVSSSLFHMWTGTIATDPFLFLQDQNRGGSNGKNVVSAPLAPAEAAPRGQPGGAATRGDPRCWASHGRSCGRRAQQERL